MKYKPVFYFLSVLSLLLILILIIIRFTDEPENSIEVVEYSNLVEKKFALSWELFSSKNGISKNNPVNLTNNDLYFNFDNKLNLNHFKYEINFQENKQISKYKIFLRNNTIYSSNVTYKSDTSVDKYLNLNLYKLFKKLDEIDFSVLINYLSNDSYYKFVIYPENSIIEEGKIYNKNDYSNSPFFVYKDKIIKEIKSEKFSVEEKSILFALYSMEKEGENSFHGTNNIFIIIPVTN
ncbi:hypothetical protein [Chengkuizengella axinellae]|uniref:Uncharacterized protein n=1 Tax=Chengkuizengella axinellae TaxID=3064388 RepID=A0ABT9IZT4_9BACL|nr:hypothetical protein [Chengkuizengella sp. 2205SS18-9]MDP5274652.1 hypothetical protein [Chengkuizengella sp. 2205SS18-9]